MLGVTLHAYRLGNGHGLREQAHKVVSMEFMQVEWGAANENTTQGRIPRRAGL